MTDKRDPAPEATADGATGAFLEAEDKTGGAWRIRVIRAGLSGNANYYPDAALREAAPLFEGARVFVKSDQEHLSGGGKDVRNLIGGLSESAFVEGAGSAATPDAGPDAGEIQATLRLIEPEGAVAAKLREAWRRGMTGLFGFSINAAGDVRRGVRGGRPIREARKFTRVDSVDLIVEPGAGGEIVDLIEARKESIMDRDEIIALLEAEGLLKGKDAATLGDDALADRLREAVAGAGKDASKDTNEDARRPAGDPAAPGTTPAAADTARAATAEDVREAVRMVEARQAMRRRLDASALPNKAKARLIARFEGAERFSENEVDRAVKDEAEYIGSFTESGRVRGLGDGDGWEGRIALGESRADKTTRMLDAFFDREDKDHRHAQSFREAYVSMTGDQRVTGQARDCDRALLRESLGSDSFDAVLGDAITRRMIKDYRAQTRYDVWRQLATTVPITDFRTQERTRFGGYGDLPAVAESASYAPLASPSDEKATYAVAKRGGTEDVTLEMIKNDDVGVIRQIPVKLSRAAKRTLAKFALDFLSRNPKIHDGKALFCKEHNNLGAAGLDKASFAAGRLAMLNQTEMDSGDKIGIPPRHLWVPDDLEEAAVDLFRRDRETDKSFIQSQRIQVMPVWYWTDANAWFLSVDPDDIPTIEIGFLDGAEEPEIFVQDSPTGGAMFSRDKLSWKIRHIYGGNVLDHRGLYGAFVAPAPARKSGEKVKQETTAGGA